MSEAVRKYLGARVPRYTSYPTAPHFSPGIGAETVRGWLTGLAPGSRLSLYLHVPFCARMCWYCGCNMRLVARYDPVEAYVDRLIAEIHQKADALGHRQSLTHIHWGGGTPTTLSQADFARVDATIRERFDVTKNAEIAVEIDPRTLDQQTVAALAQMGCNRASLGVQEFDPQVQLAINRVQPFETVAQVCRCLRDAGISALNVDLMYGLPYQTPAMLAETVRRAVELNPARIAVFGYAHVPWMAKNQRKIEEDALPSPETRFDMAEQAGAQLEALEYQAIGIDHFARPGDSLAVAARGGHLRRNFQGYTTDEADALIGLGASAISALPQGYSRTWSRPTICARSTRPPCPLPRVLSCPEKTSGGALSSSGSCATSPWTLRRSRCASASARRTSPVTSPGCARWRRTGWHGWTARRCTSPPRAGRWRGSLRPYSMSTLPVTKA